MSDEATYICPECNGEIVDEWDDSGTGEQWKFWRCSGCGEEFSQEELEDLKKVE